MDWPGNQNWWRDDSDTSSTFWWVPIVLVIAFLVTTIGGTIWALLTW